MKTKTIKKLFAFAAIAMFSFFILVANNSCQKEVSSDNNETKGKIIYTDVSPEVNDSSYMLDLNNDGVLDFSIFFSITQHNERCGPGGSVGLKTYTDGITPFGFNKAANDDGYNPGFVALIDFNSSISNLISDTAFLWNNAESQILTTRYQVVTNDPHPCATGYRGTGPWGVAIDGYIGLQLNLNGNIYFGWVRLDVASLATGSGFTVKDYAYNSIPDQPILAGQKE